MRPSPITLAFCLFFLCTCVPAPYLVGVSAQNLYFPDHPALTPDGQTLIFAYNGDLWRMPSAGGNASRITALDGAESHPKVSPDGKWLAFTSAQYGNDDVYVTPLAGGPITQLTFHEGADRVSTWDWESRTIYFTSNRYNRITTFTVPVGGGTPQRLLGHYFNNVHNVALPAGEEGFYYNESWESNNYAHRKRYKGPFNPDIRHYAPQDNLTRQLTDYEGKDMWPMTTRDGRLYFVSDRNNGEYNLYEMANGKPKRLTNFKASVFAPNVSADGSKIAFVKEYQLHTYDTKSGKTQQLPVSLNAFTGLAKTDDFSTDGKISYFDVAKDGKKLAVVSRGELFVSDIEGKFVRRIETGPGRVLEVKWHKDGKTLVFNQTAGGYQNLHAVAADGNGTVKRLTNDQRNNRNLEMSPDTSKIAFLSGRDEVRVLELDDYGVETVAKQTIWGFQNGQPRWSPDGRYLTFPGYVGFEQDIFVIDTENDNALMNLTNTGVSERDPSWGPDGKYIYFTSARAVPNYPRGGGDVNLYRLPLRKFDKPYRAERFDALFSDKKPQKDSVVVTIAADNIMERIERVGPSFGYQTGAVVVKEGGKNVVLYGSNHEGKMTLYKTVYEDFESPRTTAFKGRGVSNATDLVTVKGKHYLIGAGKVQKLNIGGAKWSPIEVKHTFRRNLEAEFTQMYYETWANMEENFYNEDFHGVDWPALRDRYAAYLPYLTNRADLRRLTNDLLGELNTSHFGFRSSGKEERTRQGARTQGLGLTYSKADPYRIESILADGPADRLDVDLQAGDLIVAIDGERVAATRNRESYLSRPSLDESLALTVSRDGKEHDVRLHPVSYFSERTNRYDAWVWNRTFTCRRIPLTGRRGGNRSWIGLLNW